MEIKILTWNVEWALPGSRRAALILESIAAVDPDVICYTEVVRDTVLPGHIVEADPDYGYPLMKGRRKILLWSKHPWTDHDVVGDAALPPGRFASGVTCGVRFVGVCIPWRGAHVNTGGRNRAPWEDHLSYCAGLKKVLQRYAEDATPICLLGDYNQRIPRAQQPSAVAEALADSIPGHFKIATAGLSDHEGQALIDHITISSGLDVAITTLLPKTATDGARLSDHTGVAGLLQ